MSYDVVESRSAAAAIALFAIIAALIGFDLAIDAREGAGWVHLVAESLVLLVSAAGIAMLWRQLRAARTDLAAARQQASAWRAENQALLQGLGSAIQVQFTRWQLTAAESEVALLLLKGLSHKEIAALRGGSERTVREQARAVYRKAELSGRAALSAFFLEDLLLPPGAAGKRG
ncbi:MAG: LuxR family transcriptional regulator [Gammaproteobacteria bacterium]|nr:LuxR family transcriptional regulator [Gammaproteobacteria bacterium]